MAASYQTVFVVGAGASSEFDLPVGGVLRSNVRQLLARIVDDLRGQSTIHDYVVRQIGLSRSDALAGAQAMSATLDVVESIDYGIMHQQANPAAVGLTKWGIAQILTAAERSQSGLAVDADGRWIGPGLESRMDTWLGRLIQRLLGRVPPEVGARRLEQVSFVTFNYDRIIRRHFGLVMQRLQYANWQELVDKLRVEHAYGSLGDLNWLDNGAVPFGGSVRTSMDYTAAHKVRTFAEAEDEGTRARIRDLIKDANQVVLMGCAFHRQNISFLTPDELGDSQRTVRATCFNVPNLEVDMGQQLLSPLCGPRGGTARPEMIGRTCSDLMKNLPPDLKLADEVNA